MVPRYWLTSKVAAKINRAPTTTTTKTPTTIVSLRMNSSRDPVEGGFLICDENRWADVWPHKQLREKELAHSHPRKRLRYSNLQLGGFLPRSLCLDMAMFRGGVLNGCIDLASDEERQAGNIKPQHQNNDSSQRSVRLAVGVKEMQVGTQASRSRPPKQNTHYGSGRYPVPMLLFDVRGKVVDRCKRKNHECECQSPLQNLHRNEGDGSQSHRLTNRFQEMSTGKHKE